jgi:hypothetical protein
MAQEGFSVKTGDIVHIMFQLMGEGYYLRMKFSFSN